METKVTKLSNSAIDLRIEDHIEQIGQLGRRLLVNAWSLGVLLIERKGRMHHGDWLPYLEQLGVKERTAQQWMRIGRSFKVDDLSRFQTIDAAERSIAAPKPAETADLPKPRNTPPPARTLPPPVRENNVIDMGERKPQFQNTEAALRHRIAQLEDERDELKERVTLGVPEEAEKVYATLREEARVARLQIGEWQGKYEDMRREVLALRKHQHAS